ncbi:MAG: MBL fold metallo-hydrolase [Planctomycetota bacterium]|nr:MAG: MBL fold metallo-hydrolase [Planctomycetota bacterium]
MTDPTHALTIDTFALGPFETNCYLVRAGEACWVIDAGFGPAPMLDRLGAERAAPDAIILTHAHADHIAGLGEARRAFPDTPILVHRAEAEFLTDPVLNLSAGFGAAVTAPPADRLLDGGETIALGPTSWRVLHTPGHSPGGISLVCDEAGVAFVGDTLFAGSIGRFDFPTSDEALLMRSIRRTLYALPGETRVLPGHGPPTTIAHERETNPFVRG